jgi:hypothetical protein
MLHLYLSCFETRFGYKPKHPEWAGYLKHLQKNSMLTMKEFKRFIVWCFECCFYRAPETPYAMQRWMPYYLREQGNGAMMIGRIEMAVDKEESRLR